MKSLLLASILLAGSPVFAETQTAKNQEIVVQKEAIVSNPEWIRSIRSDLQAGRYADFLADMDKAYQEAKASNGLEGLIEIRKTQSSTASSRFAQGYEAIQKEKNEALLKAVQGQEGAFADKVRNAATNPLNDQEQDALQALVFFRSAAPATGKNNDENQLIEIDLEYAYKSIHLDSLVAGGQTISDRKEKQLVLEMDRMDKMVQAAQGFDDAALKGQVILLASSIDARLARACDQMDLNLLAKGKVKPSTDLETQVAQVLSQANEQLAALHLEAMNAQLEATETAQK